MLHPPGGGAALTAPCHSISGLMGLRCDQPADHDGDHRFGRIIWPSGEAHTAAPSSPTEPKAPACPSICFEGLRCEQSANHLGVHSSGPRLWVRGRDSEPAAPPPAPPAPTTALERVLRIAARTLPCSDVNPGIARLDRIAFGLRNVRAYYLHDVETCSAIDAWLELYEGSR